MEITKPMNIVFPEGFNQSQFTLIMGESPTPVPLIVPQKFTAVVALSSIAALAMAGKYPADPKGNNGVVFYNMQPGKLMVKFIEDVNNPMATTMAATLESNPEFDAWGINKDQRFTVPVLIKHLRKMGHCFKDPSVIPGLIKTLQNFSVKFVSEKQKADDRQGNKSETFKTALEFTQGLISVFNWSLSMPLFKSTPKVDFSVDIEIDEQNGDPVFSFWSLEVDMMSRDLGAEIVSNEVKKLEDYFVILEQQ